MEVKPSDKEKSAVNIRRENCPEINRVPLSLQCVRYNLPACNVQSVFNVQQDNKDEDSGLARFFQYLMGYLQD